jgi:glucokinase
VEDLVVALDVGGTNARARIAAVTGERESRLVAADTSTPVTSAGEFHEFVSGVVQNAARHGRVTAAVVAVAGPVLGNQSRITNWPSDATIGLADLERAGLPADRTQLVNDVVAGAWGAGARIGDGGPLTGLQLLAAPTDREGGLGDGNLVYVAPGTGLGAAVLIRHGLGPLGASVVGCESQHTQIPRFEGEVGRVVDAIESSLGHAPSWEDLVSGRGLVHIYEALCSIAATEPPTVVAHDARSARAITEAARAGDDAQASAALNVFYLTLGHFAQMLALTFLPCFGVVIGGASTEQNLEQLRHSGLTETFARHGRFAELLGRIPIYTTGADVNLEGGIWLAARR